MQTTPALSTYVDAVRIVKVICVQAGSAQVKQKNTPEHNTHGQGTHVVLRAYMP